MTPSDVELDSILKRLHLANTRRCHLDLAAQAEEKGWSYRDFLAILMAEEVAQRKQTSIARRTRAAGFPFFKTIDEFDFDYQSTVKLQLLGSYLGPDLVTEGRNLILHGKSGRGKTHLAIAIAYRAIQHGHDARFVTAAELIDDLSTASRDGSFREVLASYTQPHVLVIDEVGYLSYGPDAANVLFHVVNNRHLKRRPMLFTTNKNPKTWGRVLHDPDLAEAIVDRALERGRYLYLDGPSVRTRHIKLDTMDQELAEPARVSGKDRPSFPEPPRRQRRRERPRAKPAGALGRLHAPVGP